MFAKKTPARWMLLLPALVWALTTQAQTAPEGRARNNKPAAAPGRTLAAADLTAARPPAKTSVADSLDKPRYAMPEGYRIGSGDALQIHVWKEPEASVPSVTVRPDGRIALPMVKEVEVVGLTPAELEKVLTEKYARFFTNQPEVSVVVRDIQSEKVYLVGAVRREGSLLLKSPMTILQVLAEAGGVSEYAKRKKIYVLRTQNNKQTRLPFNYEAVIKGEQPEQNIMVLPGDTIVVPQ